MYLGTAIQLVHEWIWVVRCSSTKRFVKGQLVAWLMKLQFILLYIRVDCFLSLFLQTQTLKLLNANRNKQKVWQPPSHAALTTALTDLSQTQFRSQKPQHLKPKQHRQHWGQSVQLCIDVVDWFTAGHLLGMPVNRGELRQSPRKSRLLFRVYWLRMYDYFGTFQLTYALTCCDGHSENHSMPEVLAGSECGCELFGAKLRWKVRLTKRFGGRSQCCKQVAIDKISGETIKYVQATGSRVREGRFFGAVRDVDMFFWRIVNAMEITGTGTIYSWIWWSRPGFSQGDPTLSLTWSPNCQPKPLTWI